MVECNLNLKDFNFGKKETVREGVIDVGTVRLKGYDEENAVEWSLTLKVREGEMPSDYDHVIGDHIGNTVTVTLGPLAQQSQLEE